MKNVLILDGYNLMHRARSGFMKGDYPVVFNFFRSLKPIVEKFDPDHVAFVIEGEPKARLELFPEYKANREIDEHDEKKRVELESFHHQKNIIIKMLKEYFPVAVMRHHNYEADDLIYTIVDRGANDTDYTVVSNDTDFIQMLNEFDNVELYSPTKKEYTDTPQYDYLTWKSLKGDSADNIPGINGIGEKTATTISQNPEQLAEVLNIKENAEIFSRNVDLIRLHSISENELAETEISIPKKNWEEVRKKFEEFEFRSMLKEPYWTKFMSTFNSLWEPK